MSARKNNAARRAVVLLSGGLDSATALYFAKKTGFKPSCLVFDYGQRHGKEIACAKKLCRAAGCSCTVLTIRLPWKGSSLLDKNQVIPEVTRTPGHQVTGKIPSTYVPGRNIIFLSFALSFAEAISARAVFIGANAIDYSGYPDCRPQFYRAFDKVIATGTKAGVQKRPLRVMAPLIDLSKAEIIKLGTALGVPYALTWSCYLGGKTPCGTCDSCRLRAKGFRQAGIADPAGKRQ